MHIQYHDQLHLQYVNFYITKTWDTAVEMSEYGHNDTYSQEIVMEPSKIKGQKNDFTLPLCLIY